jgi:hypothetical protein
MISSILQYSTIDFRFLKANLNQLTKISDEVIIPICTSFFNGEPESKDLFEQSLEIIKLYTNTKIHLFDWNGPKCGPNYYHNLSRKIGTDISKNDWLLFVDADEIIDDNFNNWFDAHKNEDTIFWFTCYWYFREPTLQSNTFEGAGLLTPKKYCNWNLEHWQERPQLLYNSNALDGYRNHFFGKDNLPLLHHYSWVRNKKDMLTKVNNWGHQHDRDWVSLVEEEFARPFNGTDFVHGYTYSTVENKFNL